ncbi:MAG: DUF1554 domain-containing protein [Deltaproteobacteria bacterium]|nr:DUF1554 domain-containing protein [Deltaproteobacteria bacterium]
MKVVRGSIVTMFFAALSFSACESPVPLTESFKTEEGNLTTEGSVSREVPVDQGDLILSTKIGERSFEFTVPSNALSPSTIVTLQEGRSLIGKDLDVGKLVISPVFSQSSAVILSSSKKENPKKPIEVRLPIPEEAFQVLKNLELTGSSVIEDPLSHLIVVYKVIDFSGNTVVKAGFQTRNQFTVEKDEVVYRTMYFGAFQLVLTVDLLETASERIAKTGIASKGNEVIISNPIEEKGEELPDEVFKINQAPAPLEEFRASLASSLAEGEIRLNFQLGEFYDYTYDYMVVLRSKGNTPPHPDCKTDGEFVAEWKSFPIKSFSYIDQTGSIIGEAFSYRACITGKTGQLLTSSNTIVGAQALDTKAPPPATSFTARTGNLSGEIILSIGWPDDRSDYAKAEVREIKSDLPPDAACGKEAGTIVASITDFSKSAYSASRITNSTIGERFSYRLCIYDRFGNLTASNTSTARAFDNQAPAPLLTFSASTGTNKVGDIDFAWTLPSDVSDYYVIRILALAGSTLPKEDCSNGLEAAQVSAPFPTSYTYATGSTSGAEYSFRVCIQDRTGNLTASNTASSVKAKSTSSSGGGEGGGGSSGGGGGGGGTGGGGGETPPPDTTAPPALQTFSAAKGTVNDGDIILSLTLPSDVSDYARVDVRRTSGSEAPSSCTVGSVVTSYTTFTASTTLTFTDATGSTIGDLFSYRVCITDRVSNLTSSNTAVGIQALDTTVPASLDRFSGLAGTNHGQITLTLDLPGNVSDYSQLTLRRVSGASAPANCTSGTAVKTYTKANGEFATDPIVYTDTATSVNPPGSFSYRACIQDTSGNLTSNIAENIAAKDATAPPSLASFSTASTTILGEIKITVDFPTDRADYASVSVRRGTNASDPAPNCSSGTLLATYTSFSVNQTITQYVSPGAIYNFTACILDLVGLQTTMTVAATANNTASHRIFVTSNTYNGNLGGLSGADTSCQGLGSALGGKWKAVLSDSATSASTRIQVLTGGIKNMAGATVAINSTDLWDNTLSAAINRTETGASFATEVWTGSNGDGTFHAATCSSWTSSSGGSITGRTGDSSITANDDWVSFRSRACDGVRALYCIDGQLAP